MDNDFGFGEQTTKEKLFNLLQALFPRYYVHKNRILSESAKYYSMLSKEALGYCGDVRFPENKAVDVEWSDLIKPNALMDQWVGSILNFKKYYSRRCFGRAHIESVKTVAAIMSYKSNYGDMPSSLQALVPEFLPSLPIDLFDGGDLKYSQEKGFLYSVGTNYSDDGGSVDSYFVRRCEQSEVCAKNPTFPILSALPAKDEY
ncbi:MAG: hypothetical protein ABW168_03720 [Sedimenticola sp.]